MLSSSTVTPSPFSPSTSTMRTVVGAIDTPSTVSTNPPANLLVVRGPSEIAYQSGRQHRSYRHVGARRYCRELFVHEDVARGNGRANPPADPSEVILPCRARGDTLVVSAAAEAAAVTAAAEATPAKAATTETASPEAAWAVAAAEPTRRPSEPAGTSTEATGITAEATRA